MLARGRKPALLRPKEAAAGWPRWAGAPLGPEPRACPQASTQLPQWARAPWEASPTSDLPLHLSEGGSGWQERQEGLAPLQMVSSDECGWWGLPGSMQTRQSSPRLRDLPGACWPLSPTGKTPGPLCLGQALGTEDGQAGPSG